MSHETLKWKLFPFYLTGIANIWYAQTVRGCQGRLGSFAKQIFSSFLPGIPICDLRAEVLGFRQKEKETLGAAWA
jgi:hypothetical protein